MSTITITGRTLADNAPVADASIFINNTVVGHTDSGGCFSVAAQSSPIAQNWSILGSSGGFHVAAGGSAVLSSSVNAGDIVLSRTPQFGMAIGIGAPGGSVSAS